MNIKNPFNLDGKTILVTGASSGIGKEISIQIDNMGGKVIALGRNKERLENIINNLEGLGHESYPGDFNCANYREDILNSIDKIDGLVNSAGIMKLLSLKMMNDTHIEEMLNVNYLSPVKFIRDLFINKKVKKGSSIVFISSMNGPIIGSKANALYSSTKAAIQSFSKGLAIDYGPQNIRFNSIAPGMILTEGIESVLLNLSDEDLKNDYKKYPLGNYGNPSDVALAAIYLLSDASKWVTGTTLVVDGGYTAQ
jgi:NAD(P)-dependent dehydrogenase (short-subunit alcohol dehydrogenase family)